jgi:CSLREA domain-containing protein
MSYTITPIALLSLLVMLGQSVVFSAPADHERWQRWQPVAPAAGTFTVNSVADDADANVLDPACKTASGDCTLRAAIQQLNYNASAITTTINFYMSGQTIQVNSTGNGKLPDIHWPVIIDGTTGSGGLVELDGSLPASGDGLTLYADNSAIRGMVINRFSSGIMVFGDNNLIEGNRIGTNVAGTAAQGNASAGVWVVGSNNTIRNNLISGNDAGVVINPHYGTGSPAANKVEGNYIGTDVNGSADLGNTRYGVWIFKSPNNTIGGTTTGARNVISGNNNRGIWIEGAEATGNVVQGNYIGTDTTGTAALPNSSGGAMVFGAPGNTIGGTTTGAGNVISGNASTGIEINSSGATGNVVQGNLIGTAVNGTAALGNTSRGIYVSSSSNNTIGGTAVGAGNTIAFNGLQGVFISGGTGNAILGNSIHSNTNLGIDLSPSGVTPNDTGDADTGANNLQNSPVLIAATSGSTVITGTLNSTTATQLRVEFFASAACDSSGNGEGQIYLGTTNATTDGSGNASFAVTLITTASAGYAITATATDPNNNTSEFSQCVLLPTKVYLPLILR